MSSLLRMRYAPHSVYVTTRHRRRTRLFVALGRSVVIRATVAWSLAPQVLVAARCARLASVLSRLLSRTSPWNPKKKCGCRFRTSLRVYFCTARGFRENVARLQDGAKMWCGRGHSRTHCRRSSDLVHVAARVMDTHVRRRGYGDGAARLRAAARTLSCAGGDEGC